MPSGVINKLISHKHLINKDCLPEKLVVKFQEVIEDFNYPRVKVFVGNKQVGDIIDDNSYQNDGYRYHDVFHYTFATLLDWSPCVRSMLKMKRKDDINIDRIEDGARATITEEAISLLIFEEAKLNNFYNEKSNVSPVILSSIKQMTSNFEVKDKTHEDWEKAILTSYELFRLLLKNKGGEISFDRKNKTINYNQIVN